MLMGGGGGAGAVPGFSKGGAPMSAKGTRFLGCPPENFENLSLQNGHFQHFETNFVLV